MLTDITEEKYLIALTEHGEFLSRLEKLSKLINLLIRSQNFPPLFNHRVLYAVKTRSFKQSERALYQTLLQNQMRYSAIPVFRILDFSKLPIFRTT